MREVDVDESSVVSLHHEPAHLPLAHPFLTVHGHQTPEEKKRELGEGKREKESREKGRGRRRVRRRNKRSMIGV